MLCLRDAVRLQRQGVETEKTRGDMKQPPNGLPLDHPPMRRTHIIKKVLDAVFTPLDAKVCNHPHCPRHRRAVEFDVLSITAKPFDEKHHLLVCKIHASGKSLKLRVPVGQATFRLVNDLTFLELKRP